MIEIFSENEVTAQNIANYMVKVGFLDDVPDTSGNYIEVVMESGLPYLVSICKPEKYINIGTSFCLEKKQTMLLRHAFEEMMDSDPVFFFISPIDDEETYVQYIVSYEYGLLPKQFISLVKRFEDFIERIEACVSRNIKPLVPA